VPAPTLIGGLGFVALSFAEFFMSEASITELMKWNFAANDSSLTGSREVKAAGSAPHGGFRRIAA
jgi:hypothetical protein